MGPGLVAAGFVLAANASWASPPEVEGLRVPGGVQAAMRAIDDPRIPDAATFAGDVIRRVHNHPADAGRTFDPLLARLLAWFESQRRLPASPAPGDSASRDIVPSALSSSTWRAVLGGTVEEPDLGHILASREASLLHWSLLELPLSSRQWMATHPDNLRALLPHAATLAIVAPWLDRDDDGWRLPGGDAMASVWSALVGRARTDPAFPLALVAAEAGWIAVLADVLGALTPEQQVAALKDGDTGPTVAGARRLMQAMRGGSVDWIPRQRPFWRPTFDPAWLLMQVPADARGLRLPGTPQQWNHLLAGRTPVAATRVDEGARLSASWLVAHVLRGPTHRRRVAWDQVLWTSRVLEALGHDEVTLDHDLAEVVAAFPAYPQLMLTLERLGVRERETLRAAVASARAVTPVRRTGSTTTDRAGLVRLQTGLMLLVHAQRNGAVEEAAIDGLIRRLTIAAREGDAAMRTWLHACVSESGATTRPTLDETVVAWVAGPHGGRVEWEGQSYAFDPAAATTDRLSGLRGPRPVPRMSEATTDALVEMVYALSMGTGEELPLRPADAAARHVFDAPAGGATQAWSAPAIVVDEGTRWHVRGSLLGLDVALAPLGVRRASRRLPSRRPNLNTADRRVLLETIALVPRPMHDRELAAGVRDALARARTRLDGAGRSASACEALVGGLTARPGRATRLAWRCRHDASSVAPAVTLVEQLELGGFDRRRLCAEHGGGSARRCVAGAPAQPVSGASELWLSRDERARASGHWGSGVSASVFPDLTLRMLGLLGELGMDARALPEVMASVIWEFVSEVPATYPDDWNALQQMVWTLDAEAVERALALQTSGGVLRPE